MSDTMTEAVTQSGVIWKRAAESLLHAIGGTEIQLVVSGSAASDENSRELGLMSSESRQFAISPAVVNWLTTKPGERARAEVTMAAASLEDAVEAVGMSSGKDLLESALAIVIGDQRLRIAAVQVGAAGGADYLYTVTALV
ncbi:MAG: hypothetical protein ACXWC0_22790 [Burkholderiales bacterium]